MSISRTRKVSRVSTLLWSAVVAAAWYFGGAATADYNARLYGRALQHTQGFTGGAPQLVPYGEQVQTEEITITERSRECPLAGMVELNNKEAASAFAALPLGPQDMAVLLNKLSAAGVQTVGLSASFMWKDGVGDMGKQLLCHVLTRFPHSAVGLRGRTAAQAEFTPTMLRDAAIPADNITGDPAKLPMANKPLPNGLTDTPDSVSISWAPDWLQDEPLTHKASAVENLSFPLLVRWNGDTIPTLPFRLALAHLGISPAEVKVNIGKDIRYGGFVLPLDEYGRTRLTDDKVAMLPLQDVLEGGGAVQDIQLVMLEQPDEAKTEPLRLERLARTLSQMAGREKLTQHTEQRPVGGAALHAAWCPLRPLYACLAFAALVLVLHFVPRMLPGKLLTAIPLVGMLWVLWRAYTLLAAGLWLPVVPLLLFLAVLAAALRLHKPKTAAPGRRI